MGETTDRAHLNIRITRVFDNAILITIADEGLRKILKAEPIRLRCEFVVLMLLTGNLDPSFPASSSAEAMSLRITLQVRNVTVNTNIRGFLSLVLRS